MKNSYAYAAALAVLLAAAPLASASDDPVAAPGKTVTGCVTTTNDGKNFVLTEASKDMRAGVGGSLRFLAESATDRFLRIQLNRSVARLWQVALLGHATFRACPSRSARVTWRTFRAWVPPPV